MFISLKILALAFPAWAAWTTSPLVAGGGRRAGTLSGAGAYTSYLPIMSRGSQADVPNDRPAGCPTQQPNVRVLGWPWGPCGHTAAVLGCVHHTTPGPGSPGRPGEFRECRKEVIFHQGQPSPWGHVSHPIAAMSSSPSAILCLSCAAICSHLDPALTGQPM